MSTDRDVEAARLALLMREEAVQFEQIDLALRWTEASQENRAAFERANRFLDICDDLKGDAEAYASLSATMRKPKGFLKRFEAVRFEFSVAASIMLVLTTCLAYWFSQKPEQAISFESSHYATVVGEHRRILLPDGSIVALGGASSIGVTFSSSGRHIILIGGEAQFDVAHDPHRPFVVDAGPGSTTAVGTAFDIHTDSDGVTVTVLRGIVDVSAKGHQGPKRLRLEAAMQVDYSADGKMNGARQANLDFASGWQNGRLSFVNQPLRRVVADLNRYSTIPIAIEGKNIEDMPITGSVQIQHIAEWLQGLSNLGGITTRQEPGKFVVSRSRPS